MGPLLAIGLLLQIGARGDVAALGAEVERAVIAGDTAVLERVRERLLNEIQRGGALPLERYTLAYVDWRLTYLREERRDATRTQLFDEAEAQLRTIGNADAEALALLGAIYGARIAEGANAMRLGPRATHAISEAAKFAPSNPRVALLRGIHFFFTPAPFGGGIERAEAELRRAEELFARERGDQPWPNWGRVDALGWLGQALMKTRDYAGARAAYDRALAIEPNHGWIRSLVATLEAKQKSRRSPKS